MHQETMERQERFLQLFEKMIEKKNNTSQN